MSAPKRWKRPDPDIIRAAIRSLALSEEERARRLAEADPQLALFLRAEIAHLRHGLENWPFPYKDWADDLEDPSEWDAKGARVIYLERFHDTGTLDDFYALLAEQGLPAARAA